MKNCIRLFCFIVLQLIVVVICGGIVSGEPLNFKVLADLQSQALTFLKDSDGFIWIGTYVDGLYRFDGKKLKHYTKASGFIRSNNVPAIMEDKNGLLWFVSAGGGLSVYDKEKDKTIVYAHWPDEPESLSSNSFFWAGKNIIRQDRQGDIWIGTIGGGLNHYDKKRRIFSHYRHHPDDHTSISSDNVRCVYPDADGRIWVGTENGLNVLNPKTQTFKWIPLEPKEALTRTGKIIMAVTRDSRGNLWVGTENNGLYRMDADEKEFKIFKNDPKKKTSPPSNRVVFIMEDGNKKIWICHEDKFCVYSYEEKVFTRFDGEKYDLTMSFQDPTGDLTWGLTDTGKIMIHNPMGSFFKQYGAQTAEKSGLSSEIVISIFEDSKGILWISTLKGFNRYDPKTGEFTHYFHEPGNPETLPSKANYSPGIFEDRHGNFWVGNSVPSALSLFNRTTGKVIKNYMPAPGNPEAMPDAQQINRMIDDKKDPDIMWISTAKGLVRFNRKTQKFKTFGDDNSWCLFEDDEQNIWFSTWGNGIGRFDKATQKLAYFRHDPKDEKSISDNLLVPIFIASDNRIWIGTENGLNLFDKKHKTFKSYKRSDGYPFDAVHSIGEDRAKNLWLGTNSGLVRFNPVSEKAKAFTKEDGIDSVMFYANNGIMSKSGEMWFGGTKGMNSFFPGQIQNNRHVPEIKLTAIKQGGEVIGFGKAPERLRSITLDWRTNYFEFEFAAIDYAAPMKNEYAYMLKGNDKKWFYSGHNNFGRYSGLAPGSYTLRLKGSNNDGIWNEAGISIDIRVLPPFWKTGWFYSFVLLATACMIMLAVFYMVRLNSEVNFRKKAEKKLVESNERLKILDKLKDEFLANTSHELRTPLTGIIGLSESLISGAGGQLAPQVRKDLGMIAASGQRLANLVNDILDFSKLRHKDIELNLMAVDMKSLTDVVLAISRPIAVSKPIVLENRIPDNFPYALGDENRLQQILFNLVGNAIKFTQEGKIVISGQVVDKLLEISVFDTGIGIPEEKHAAIFESFEQADGTIEREYSGTGLGLAVSRQLVELHGGRIGLTSKPGEGSVFYFTIPVSDRIQTQLKEPQPQMAMLDLQSDEILNDDPANVFNPEDWSSDKPNILVVDDEAVNLKVLANHLSLQDYNVTQVSNGIDALKTIEQMETKGLLFDLILLDVMMPRMSGYEVCEKLRQKYPADKLPVVMLTAKNRAEDLAAGLKSGANDYLTKPFNKTELLARIKNQKDLKDLARKREESRIALLETEKQYRDLFNNLVDVFYRTDLEGRLTLVSPSFETVLGYSPEEAVGMSVAEALYVVPRRRDDLLEKLEKDGQVKGFEAQLRKKDGTVIWVVTSSRIYYDELRNRAGVEGILRDITRQKQAEQMRDLLAAVIEQASEFIIITDTKGKILYVNPAFEAGTGYRKQEVLGKNPKILKSGKHDELFYKDLWETILAGKVWKGRITNKRKDHSYFEEEAFITPVKEPGGKIINFVAVKRDITKEAHLEAQLLQSQKMESIGTLAGGIAHDFNNILSAIMGYTEIGLMDASDERISSSLKKILKAGNRAKDLVQQILTFSRQTQIEPRPVNVAVIVKEVAKLLRASLPSSIEIHTDIRSRSRILADPTQIHQILMNLATNAGHAMRKSGGELSIELTDEKFGKKANKKFIRLSVSDTGEGMSLEISNRIFDPFYTTKEKGQGTGMGLSVVHGIVERCKGYIEVDSRIGAGSRFDIHLPVFEENHLDENRKEEPFLFGSEKILFVDDEPVQTELGKQLLEKLGYRVDTENDPLKALETFRHDPDAYDVIITDMTMPKLTGDNLSRQILSVKADMPIILCTGYNQRITKEKAMALGIKGYASKPVVLADMSRILRQVLDHR